MIKKTLNKKYVFDTEEVLVDDLVDFIKKFRNTKAENNITKDFKINLNNKNELVINMLKLTDNITDDILDINSYKVSSNNISATIYFEKKMTEEDIKLLEKQIESLKNSIERRKKLLSNEGYVNKAPKELVEKERETLANEEKQLALLTK